MPKWVYHPSFRYSRDKRVAHRIFSLLDLPGPNHFKWRRWSHDVVRAAVIGYLIGGREGLNIAIRHLVEDEVFQRLRGLNVPEEVAERVVFRLMSGEKGKRKAK